MVDEDQVQVEGGDEQPVEAESPTADETVQAEDTTSEPEGAEAVNPDEDRVPEGFNPDQARAFKEQRQEIRRLQEELKQRQAVNQSAFEPYVKANAQAIDPQHQAAYVQMVVDRQLDLAKTRLTFPELDPENTKIFNPELEEAVADKWIGSQTRGTPKSMMACARDIIEKNQKTIAKAVKKETQAVAEEAREQVSLRERSSSAAPLHTSNVRTDSRDLDDLRERSKHGDMFAIAERINRLGGKR